MDPNPRIQKEEQDCIIAFVSHIVIKKKVSGGLACGAGEAPEPRKVRV